eukprot:TRINITY_DN49563_c0_g1_i1.p1 TRINITY_DN49563_c0_g1~~TRINITY_DN49563_c0_g1_i1.p1  ORF type:complete len:480 (-),score=63.00 TRINITY_DN49563_c0_g1_i1:184-1623(-)
MCIRDRYQRRVREVSMRSTMASKDDGGISMPGLADLDKTGMNAAPKVSSDMPDLTYEESNCVNCLSVINPSSDKNKPWRLCLRLFVKADFLSSRLPKWISRDFHSYEQLEDHHDNLQLDVHLDDNEQKLLAHRSSRVRRLGGCLSVTATTILVFVFVFYLVSIFVSNTFTTVGVDSWSSGNQTMPSSAFQLPSGYGYKVQNCLIADGDFVNGFSCQDISSAVYSCTITEFASTSLQCLPENLQVQGTFGSSSYYYISVALTPSDNVATSADTNILLKDQFLNPKQPSWHAIYYTWPATVQTSVEVFLTRVAFEQYGRDGLPPEYSLDPSSLGLDDSLAYSRHYGREGACVNSDCNDTQNVPFTFFLRAEKSKQSFKVRYEYTIPSTIGALGGLFTGLTFLCLLPVALVQIFGVCCASIASDAFTRDVAMRNERALRETSVAEDEIGTCGILRAQTTFISPFEPEGKTQHKVRTLHHQTF